MSVNPIQVTGQKVIKSKQKQTTQLILTVTMKHFLIPDILGDMCFAADS